MRDASIHITAGTAIELVKPRTKADRRIEKPVVVLWVRKKISDAEGDEPLPVVFARDRVGHVEHR